MRGFVSGIIFTIIVILAGGFAIAKMGYVNFRADQPPSRLERKIAMAAVDASTERGSADQRNALLPTDANLVEGAKVYANNCAGCHGSPQNKISDFGRSFYPPTPQFFKHAPDMSDSQDYYIIEHGVRWTGMPAWNKMLTEQKIWQVVTFLSRIEKLPPAALQQLEPSTSASK